MAESWNKKVHPQVVGVTIGNRQETAPLSVVLNEDDDGVTLDMVLGVGLEVGVTAARLPGRGETVKVTLHLGDKTAVQVTGRVDLVGQAWTTAPVGQARLRIKAPKVVLMPSLVVVGKVPEKVPEAAPEVAPEAVP